MINVASGNQNTERIIDQEMSASLSRYFGDFMQFPGNERACGLSFVAYSVWRREENGDGNLSDQQVFVISNGQVRPLPPRNDLRNHSPDGFSWGYSGSGPAQLSLAMLMQVFQDWSRVQPIYQIFKERFVARIPQHANWTADGADVHAVALEIGKQLK
jgi:Family of unknown function (DUF6166)